ncbi:hypothetical protein KKA00_09320 [bacterium]|nr:hypothetical protein [bacterium]MBU1652409.1 hypothetical protein [bacterium]MBU1881057.1 hypothetical protein [bacterium]
MKSNRFFLKAAILATLAGLLLLAPASVVQAKPGGAIIDGIYASIQAQQSDLPVAQSLKTFWTRFFERCNSNSGFPIQSPDGNGTAGKPQNPRLPDGGENGCFKVEKP